jgi:hypothetical protein
VLDRASADHDIFPADTSDALRNLDKRESRHVERKVHRDPPRLSGRASRDLLLAISKCAATASKTSSSVRSPSPIFLLRAAALQIAISENLTDWRSLLRPMQNADHSNELALDAIEDTVQVFWLDQHVYISFIGQFAKQRQLLEPFDR